MGTEPTWHVLLIGGASGVGKTSISYRLAQHFGIGITEVDDFQVILEHMTLATQYPALHLFPTDPAAFFRMTEDEKVDHFVRCGTEMAEALEHVIANHLDGASPIVLEGDFILPSVMVREDYAGIPAAGRVQGLILYEQDEAQLARNYAAREGEPQPERGRMSWRNSEWLRGEANRLGVPAIAARPWETVLTRALQAIGEF